jgi:large subunit ribosomal protein L31
MKKDIHPKLNPVVFVDTTCGAEFPTHSTMTSKETKKINGVDHYVIRIEVSSASHPFYTGEKMLVDTAGRVDKFRARMEEAKKLQAKAEARKVKKDVQSKETVEERITRKAKENTEVKEVAKEEAKKPVKKAAVKKEETKKPAAKKAPAKKATAKKK